MKRNILILLLVVISVVIALSTRFFIDEYNQMALLNTASSFIQKAPSVRCENNLPVVSLSWQSINRGATYSIQRKIAPTDPWTGNLDSQITGFSYEDKRWQADYGAFTYIYRIVENKKRTKIYSNEVSIAVPNCRGIVATSTTPMASVTPPKATSTSATTSTSSVPATANTKIPSTVKWGAFVGWQPDAMTKFEALVGKKPFYEMVFSHWGNDLNFPTAYNARIRDQGRTMVLFWEAVDYNRDYFSQPEYSFDAVLSGKLDPYFINFAKGAKEYGGEVIIIPYSEFNGNWFPWSVSLGANGGKFVESYRYLTKFFADAPNVKFAWVPNNDSLPDTPQNQFELFYPGSDVVDYVGVDGFNFGGTQQQSFDQVFGSPLTRLQQYKKPIIIFSTASAEYSGKPERIKDALTVQLYRHPQVVGFLWFNENKEKDWRVNSSAASLEAFKSALP